MESSPAPTTTSVESSSSSSPATTPRHLHSSCAMTGAAAGAGSSAAASRKRVRGPTGSLQAPASKLPMTSVLDVAEFSMHTSTTLLQMFHSGLLSPSSSLDTAIALYSLADAAVYIHPDGIFPLHSGPVPIGELSVLRMPTSELAVPSVLAVKLLSSSPLLTCLVRNGGNSTKQVLFAVCAPATKETVNLVSDSGTVCSCNLTHPRDRRREESPPPPLPHGRFMDLSLKHIDNALSKSLCLEQVSTIPTILHGTPRINTFVVIDDVLNKRAELVPIHVAFERIRSCTRILLDAAERYGMHVPTTTTPYALTHVLNTSLSKMMLEACAADRQLDMELFVVRKMMDATKPLLWNDTVLKPAFIPPPPQCYLSEMDMDEIQQDPLYEGMSSVPTIKIITNSWFCNRCAALAKVRTPDGVLHIALDSLLRMFETQAGLRWIRKQNVNLTEAEREMRNRGGAMRRMGGGDQHYSAGTSLVVYGKHPHSVKFLKHTFLHVASTSDPASSPSRPACPFGCYLIKNWTVDNPQGAGMDTEIEERVDARIMHGAISSREVRHMSVQIQNSLISHLYLLLRSSSMRTVTTSRQSQRLVDGGWALYSYLSWACNAMEFAFGNSTGAELPLRAVMTDVSRPVVVLMDTESPAMAMESAAVHSNTQTTNDRCSVCFDRTCVCEVEQREVPRTTSTTRLVSTQGVMEVVVTSTSNTTTAPAAPAAPAAPTTTAAPAALAVRASPPPAPFSVARVSLYEVIRRSLKPRCPSCQATYVLGEGCTHIHCPECAAHHCFTCGRQYPVDLLPNTGKEMVGKIKIAVEQIARSAGDQVGRVDRVAVDIMDTFALPYPHERLVHAAYLLERLRPGLFMRLAHTTGHDVELTAAECEQALATVSSSSTSTPEPVPMTVLRHISQELHLAFRTSSLRFNQRFTHAINENFRYGSCPIYIEDFVDVRFAEDADDAEDTDVEDADEDKSTRADHHKAKFCIFDTRMGLSMTLDLELGDSPESAMIVPETPQPTEEPAEPPAAPATPPPTAPATATGTATAPPPTAPPTAPPARRPARMHYEILGRMAIHESGTSEEIKEEDEDGDDDSETEPSAKETIRLGAGLMLRFVNFVYRWLRRNRVQAEMKGIDQYDYLFSSLLASGREWARANGVTTIKQLMRHPLTVESFMAFLHIDYGGMKLYNRLLFTLSQTNFRFMHEFHETSHSLEASGRGAHEPVDDYGGHDEYWSPMANADMCLASVMSRVKGPQPGDINLFKLCSME